MSSESIRIVLYAPETTFNKELVCTGGEMKITGRNIVVTLKAGESADYQIEVTRLYDMSAPREIFDTG